MSDEVGKRPPSTAEALDKGALSSLGGGEFGREGGTPLVEAGVSLAKLGLALSGRGDAVQAGLARGAREVRRQGRTPVRAVRGMEVKSRALGGIGSGTGSGGAGHAHTMRGG